MTAMTATQKARLTKSMRAAQDVELGARVGVMNKIEVTAAFGDFTDGGGTSGTYTLTETVPIGATVYISALQSLVGFAGDTSATIQIGDGTDVDRYSTGTPDVFTTVAGGVAVGVVSGTAYHAVAKAPVITITAGSDWGSVTAGSVTLALFYFV